MVPSPIPSTQEQERPFIVPHIHLTNHESHSTYTDPRTGREWIMTNLNFVPQITPINVPAAPFRCDPIGRPHDDAASRMYCEYGPGGVTWWCHDGPGTRHRRLTTDEAVRMVSQRVYREIRDAAPAASSSTSRMSEPD